MRRPAPLPPDLIGSAIRTSEHEQLWGVGRSRLRAADVAHPFRGVSVAGDVGDGPVGRAHAYAPLLRVGDAFSHSTAALLLGAELPWALEREQIVHVAACSGGDRPQRRGVVGHRLMLQFKPVVAEGLPVCAAPDVWLQLAPMLDLADLVAVGDRFVTGRRLKYGRELPMTSVAELELACSPARGARGAARARKALPLIRIGPDSRAESALRLVLLNAGFPEPLIGHATPVQGGILHPDLKFPQWKVVLEYEGDHHRTDPSQWRADITRRERFESAGWRVIRVTADDLRGENRNAFLARVRAIIALQMAG